ncbi:hypothetical protein [Escherichia coli]|uniref:hypothetical protein n=1 Tax=Escherichia coli TaxID=562 RepID=UPI000BDE5A6A|nr:hypothetical protein [Escherichia coli]
MNNMDIVKAVKDGMKKSADATYLMDFRSGAKINTEYVATVSIGLSLLEIKSFRHGDYKVIFEYHTNKFINATVPLSKRSDPQKIFSKKTVRKNTNTTRSGRIDIAILDSRPFFEIPICAIEVKGNAPCKSLLFSDIRRNLEYFKHTGPTGNSSLGLALNCSFHSYNDSTKKNYCTTIHHKEDMIRKLKNKYKKYISELNEEIPDDISVTIDVFTAAEHLLSPDADQYEYESHIDDLHLTLGVMVIFERKSILN